MSRKIAGHVSGGKLFDYGSCIVLYGRMMIDRRGEDRHGNTRDFSGRPVRTSWVETLVYSAEADTTTVYTRNSVYYTQGNLIEEYLSEPEGTAMIDGKTNIFESYQRRHEGQTQQSH